MKLTQDKLDEFLKTNHYCFICQKFAKSLENKNLEESQIILNNYTGMICGGLEGLFYNPIENE